jgi:UDP-N-acetylmuramyl pentapeptide phosphotransferase/UDP-N-acetylglucosamine-1-phosphate transferase
MPRGAGSVVLGATFGAVAQALAERRLRRGPPGGAEQWARTNHAGRPVSLVGGPAFVVAATTAACVAPGPPRLRAAVALAVAGSGAVGLYDDLAGVTHARGLRGHLAALARGEVTTGALKIAGLGAVGLFAARVAGARGLDSLVTGAAVAGSANVGNLLDLRPGRALKVGLLAGGPALRGSGGPAAAVLGAAAAALPSDLGERTMLGDTGAGALGAGVGLALAARSDARGRRRLLAGVVALTLASEKVSFTRVIAAVPPLRAIDELGRRPAERS